MTQISIHKLRKQFGSTVVLHDVSIEVPAGAFAVLVGPSGCGKSTLLRLMAGLEQADGGHIRFDDRDVTQLEPRDRDVAMVFQSYALYPHLSVRDNLAFGLRLRKASEAQIAERVREVSAMLGLEQLLDRMPKALSGGQRQRVAMGRAIVRRPSLFLFDEPLSNLDAALRAQVRIDIRKLHDQLGATSVYVTHDQVEAMTLADVMFVLDRGRVEQAGAPLEVYERPRTRFVAGFLGSPAMNFIDGVIEEGRVKLAGATLPLPGDAFEKHDGPVCVGIRPHDLQACDPGDPAALGATITYVEALGGETYAYAALPADNGAAAASLVARLGAGFRGAAGDPLHLSVAPSQLHLFDARGESLRR